MYAGNTASLSAQAASAPRANKSRSRYFASSSEGRLPDSLKSCGVIQGRTMKMTTATPAKMNVLNVNGAKMKPSASTVSEIVDEAGGEHDLPVVGLVESILQHHCVNDGDGGRR